MKQYRDSLNIIILLTFILVFYSIDPLCAAKAPKNLACLNDYVVTISCVVNISIDPQHDGNDSYWLKFERGDTNCQTNFSSSMKFECPLVKQKDHFCCTFKSVEPFLDTEYFVIAFCSKKNAGKPCLELDKCYMPVHHIKPMGPTNLKVYRSSGDYQFIWDSGYESYIPATFMKRLIYHLQYYKHGHPENAITIHSIDKTQKIDGLKFEPGTEYIAKVRSRPSQIFYKGQWSEWSNAIEWRTNESQDATPSAKAVLLTWSLSLLACMFVGVLVFLHCRPMARCRIKSHYRVPTPAPYFQPLYSNYNGDFQSWLMSQGNQGDTNEETLKIETLIEAAPILNEEPFLPLPSINPYINVCDMAEKDKLDVLPGQSIQKSSCKMFSSLSLEQSSRSGNDPGSEDLIQSSTSCWLLHAVSSLDPQSVFCSEDYCTITDTHKNQEPGNSPREVIPRA